MTGGDGHDETVSPALADGSGQDKDRSGHGKYDEVVQFGSGRTSGSRWLPRIALACLVLAAIVAIAVRGTDQPARRAAYSPPPAVRVITIGHALLGVTAGWQLFARGPDDLVRFQLAQGKISVTYVPTLESANPNAAFVIGTHQAVIRSTDLMPGYVVPDGGEARQLTGLLAGDGPLIPGPAPSQAAWVTSGSPASPALSLITLTGRHAGPTIRFRRGGPQLPATAVSDGRGYALVTTGRFSVYDAGPGWDRPVPGTVVAVGRANWLVISCDPLYRHCHNEVVEIADGARRVLPGPAAGYPYDEFSWPPTGVIAPDNRTAAVAESDRDGRLTVHLLNLRSGANRNLKIVLGMPGSNLAASAHLSDQLMVWSPDSRWLFVAAAGGRLVAVDARTGRAEHLGITLPAVAQVAIRA
jgi:hypothetical protein